MKSGHHSLPMLIKTGIGEGHEEGQQERKKKKRNVKIMAEVPHQSRSFLQQSTASACTKSHFYFMPLINPHACQTVRELPHWLLDVYVLSTYVLCAYKANSKNRPKRMNVEVFIEKIHLRELERH